MTWCLTVAHPRIANDGTKMYIRTNKDAPRYKVIAVDLADQNREIKELIPQDKEAHLETIRAIDKDKFALVYKRNVSLRPPH